MHADSIQASNSLISYYWLVDGATSNNTTLVTDYTTAHKDFGETNERERESSPLPSLALPSHLVYMELAGPVI